MDLRLVVRTPGKWQGRTILVNRSPFVIGRDPACQLRPTSALVSSRHCVLVAKDGRFFVRDLGSTNGTFVNGQRLEREQELRYGDVLQIGPLDFEATADAAPRVNQPTPLPPAKAPTPSSADRSALFLALEQKSSLLLQNPGIENEEVPAGKTAVDIRLPPRRRPPEGEAVEVDEEEATGRPGAFGRMWLAARSALRSYLGLAPRR